MTSENHKIAKKNVKTQTEDSKQTSTISGIYRAQGPFWGDEIGRNVRDLLQKPMRAYHLVQRPFHICSTGIIFYFDPEVESMAHDPITVQEHRRTYFFDHLLIIITLLLDFPNKRKRTACKALLRIRDFCTSVTFVEKSVVCSEFTTPE